MAGEVDEVFEILLENAGLDVEIDPTFDVKYGIEMICPTDFLDMATHNRAKSI